MFDSYAFEDEDNILYRSFKKYIKTPLKILWESITKTVEWLPIIWSDRDWDYTYMHIIQKKKLEMILNYQIKYGHAEDPFKDQNIKYIKKAIILLDRIMEDDFFPMKHSDAFGPLEFLETDNPNLMEIKSNLKISREELDNAYEIEEALRNKTKKTFYSILEKRSDRWWD